MRKTLDFTRKTFDFTRKTYDFTRKTVIYGTNGLPYESEPCWPMYTRHEWCYTRTHTHPIGVLRGGAKGALAPPPLKLVKV